ncbi:hypothetical protein TNCV_1665141 [Trichonephila clavipes]|uniref:Uncharacterized protein n=1 Tax=Trichonephila clavipes TaxID=2585209 RepID=A0A8X6RX87_TRICX|nr:hypothetical protein TNCV_1665141 [Trichonephila clavipes]
MRAKAYCAHPSKRDRWTLRCVNIMSRSGGQSEARPQVFKSPSLEASETPSSPFGLRDKIPAYLTLLAMKYKKFGQIVPIDNFLAWDLYPIWRQ